MHDDALAAAVPDWRAHPLVRHTPLLEIAGDTARLRARGVALGELAWIDNADGRRLLARAIELQGELVTLEVFSGGRGLATDARVRFLGRPLEVRASRRLLGRAFDGTGRARDGGPALDDEPRAEVDGAQVNPVRRRLPRSMIRTDIPMIDVFNCLVESQKIPIFSVAGEPYNALLARIGVQAEADGVVFGGIGLLFDDYHFFRRMFEQRGVFHRTAMFVNLAGDPVAERLPVPDLALALAERLAIDEGARVLVLLTDMTAWADALKEEGVTLERIPANRGYVGDLYTQLARRYERACQFPDGGSVTVLAVTTMPGHDLTHPVPDNTGYITEGQFYLHDGVIDPFGSLSRLKQRVIGSATREDHGPLMDALVRLYAQGEEAQRKRSMAFDLSERDQRLLEFGAAFRQRFMQVEAALDAGWQMLAETLRPEDTPLRRKLIAQHWPGAGGSSITLPTDMP
jgi:V/A-type H+/Na+-transporting ATPase subunit B